MPPAMLWRFIMREHWRDMGNPVVRGFLDYSHFTKQLSVNTLNAYYFDLSKFIKWVYVRRPADCNGPIGIDDFEKLTEPDLIDYLIWLDEIKHLSISSRARQLSAIREFYQYLYSVTQQIPSDPTGGIPSIRRPKRYPLCMTATQTQTLFETAKNSNSTYVLRDITILTLFLGCGLLVSELVGLDLDRVGKDWITVVGPNGKSRTLSLTEPVQRQLRLYLDMRYGLQTSKSDDALFLSRRNRRISIRRVQMMIDEKLRAAGFDAKSCSPRKLRDTAVAALLNDGIEISDLQLILGHESLKTTSRYQRT